MSIFTRYLYLLLSLLLCGTQVLTAQNPHPAWRNYTTDHGLPSPEVHYCLETPDGYMWFATDNGLSRFDGYSFKNYGIKEGLDNPVIFYMQLDPQGRLWLATSNGALYYLEHDRIQAFEQNDVIRSFKGKSTKAIDFYIDDTGRKYLSLDNVGILEFSDHAAVVIHDPTNPYIIQFGIKINNRWLSGRKSLQDPYRSVVKEKYWDKGLLPPIQLAGDNTYQFSKLKKYIISNHPSAAKRFSGDRTLVYLDHNLFEVSDEKILWSQYVSYSLANKSIFEADDKTIFVGLQEGLGLRHYKNIDAWKQEVFDQYLPGKSITHLFKDDKGGLWLSTIEHGVFYCSNLDLMIFDESSGILDANVSSMAHKNQEEIYLGMRNGRVYHLNTKNYSLKLLPKIPNTAIIYDLVYHPTLDELWAGTIRNAYYKNGKWGQVMRKKTAELAPHYVLGKNLSIGKGGRLLWGGNSYSFGAIDLFEKQVVFYAYDLGIVGRTLAVLESEDGKVWVGNIDGLFELKDSALQAPSPLQPAFQTRVEDLAEMSDGTLVIASKGQGLLLKKDQHFRQFTTAAGLSSDMIENVYVDARDNIWVGTLSGLNKLSGFRWAADYAASIRQFTVYNGLPSNEINKVEVWGNTVWVATTKGLVHFSDKTSLDTASRQPAIQQVLINGTTLESEGSPSLSYWQNELVLQFLTINFQQDGKIPYRYRLRPSQTNWTPTQQRMINFSALSPGSYTFEVQSQNEDGFWSASTKYAFVIHPAFWNTWWFLMLAVSLIGFLVFRLFKYRTNQIRHEAEVVKQMADLERSALRAQMNPHFIFNCLNSISNFINKGDNVAANHFLSTFSKLIRAALNHSRANKISLEDELDLLKNYLSLEQVRFEDRFDYEITVADNVEPFEINIPPMLVQPFVENAIIHGLTQKDKKGHISLHFERQGDYLIINITDNGIGIEQSQKQKAGVESLRKSVGMTITKRRLEMLQMEGKKGAILVEELKGPDGSVLGTRVQVKVGI